MKRQDAFFRELIADPETDLGLDPSWLQIYPYESLAMPGHTRRFEMRAQNHRQRRIKLEAVLALPPRWRSDPASVKLSIAAGESGNAPVSIRFRGTRLVKDLAVWGTAVWDRRSLSVDATLRVAGPGLVHGTVRITWSTHDDTAAELTGELHGRRLHLTMPSPWRPQG